MPILGLGLGLDKVLNISLNPPTDELLQALQNANSTMCLIGSRADGTNPGTNAPFSTTWVDIVGSNDATLTNFAGTAASGWDSVTVPSGTEQMLKADGVDDYGVIANSPSLDPTGTEDFAICLIFKTDATFGTNRYIFAKADDGISANHQFSLILFSDGLLQYRGTGVSTNLGNLTTETIYDVTIKRISSNLKILLNGVEVYNNVYATSVLSQTIFSVFNRLSTSSLYSREEIGTFTFFYNGATGLNEANVDAACALLRAPYF